MFFSTVQAGSTWWLCDELCKVLELKTLHSLWTAMTAKQGVKCALDGFHGEGFTDGKGTDGSLVVRTAVVVVSGSPSPVASVLGITVARAVGAPRRHPLGRDHRCGDKLLDAGDVPHGWDCNPGVCGAAQGHGCSRSRTGR